MIGPREPRNDIGSPYVSIILADTFTRFPDGKVLAENIGTFQWTITADAEEIEIHAFLSIYYTQNARGGHTLDFVIADETRPLAIIKSEPLEFGSVGMFQAVCRTVRVKLSAGLYALHVVLDGSRRAATPINVVRAATSTHG